MSRRRTSHGIGHRIGNWCGRIIWAMFLIGVPILASNHPHH